MDAEADGLFVLVVVTLLVEVVVCDRVEDGVKVEVADRPQKLLCNPFHHPYLLQPTNFLLPKIQLGCQKLQVKLL